MKTQPLSRRLTGGISVSLFLLCDRASANVAMSPLFGDDMILQRGIPVPLWGTADAGEALTVVLGTQSKTVQTGADGKWRVNFDPLPATESTSLTVSGKNKPSFKNVAVGEV